MEWTKGKAIGAGLAGLLVVAAIAGSAEQEPGSERAGGAAPAAEQTSRPEPEEQETPELELEVPEDRSVYATSVKLTGTVGAGGGDLSGVTVKVDGKTAVLRDGRWSKTVQLKRGSNRFEVEARKPGAVDDDATVTVTRKRTQAEIAAAAAQRKQAFIAQARSIPYNQLEKNADRYAGEKVVFRGQIMQIQESFGSTFMLLSVTDEGYGFWTDNVWVDYEGTIKGAEDDIITVYGTIEGSKSYETQIGGETYVPQMTARYVVE